MVDGVVGNADVVFPSEVRLGDDHDIYVMGIEKQFKFIPVLDEAVGIPDGELKEFSLYWSLTRTEVRRFNRDAIWSKRAFIMVLSS